MDQDIKNIQQENVHLWQRLIAIENRLSGYDAVFTNINARIDAHGSRLNTMIADVSVLTEARQRQIKFNTDIKAGLDTILAQQKQENIVPSANPFTRWFKK